MAEETGQEFKVISHFYTTDFFQPSAFDPSHQVISIYYTIQPVELPKFAVNLIPFQFENAEDGAQSLRWINVRELTEDTFHLPIDRTVGKKIKENYG
jgi:ADP-ribose pyrophosphatase YjhB (NUDIX family)